jgi:divalent metal cation (Fe/Co/Zn/Cd) transporter
LFCRYVELSVKPLACRLEPLDSLVLLSHAAAAVADTALAQLTGFALGLADEKRTAAHRFGLIELLFFGQNLISLDVSFR